MTFWAALISRIRSLNKRTASNAAYSAVAVATSVVPASAEPPSSPMPIMVTVVAARRPAYPAAVDATDRKPQIEQRQFVSGGAQVGAQVRNLRIGHFPTGDVGVELDLAVQQSLLQVQPARLDGDDVVRRAGAINDGQELRPAGGHYVQKRQANLR